MGQITRRQLLLASSALGAVALGVPGISPAQAPSALRRVGTLQVGSVVTARPMAEAFRQALKELGWVEGRDIVLDARYADGDVKRMDALIAELIALKPDLIYAPTTSAALVAQRATRTIPIVFAFTSDPVGDRLISSLSRPGGNITGLSAVGVDLVPKRLQTLVDCVPKVSRVVYLTDPTIAYAARSLEDVRRAAAQLGIALRSLDVSSDSQFEATFDEVARDRPDGVLVGDSPLFHFHRSTIAARMAAMRIPAIYPIRQFAEEGGLLAFGTNYLDQARRAAGYVDKILKGAKPADLPVQQPVKYELVINMKAARALGLKIPQSILLRADQVIE